MTPSPDPPLVIWTVAARRHLRQALAEAVARRGPRALDNVMTDLSCRLHTLFPGARAVAVQNQYLGYRRRDDEFILLVEVDGTARPGRHVVKLGPEARLVAELHAWESCQPHGLRHDLVFMTLEPCQDGDCLIGLVYGDAQQFLGGVPAVALEHAFLEAVRHGTPSPASVADALVQLYERVGHLLYGQFFVDDPAQPDFVLDVPHLEAGLAGWRCGDPALVRQEVNTWAAPGRGEFRDPVDYLEFVGACVPWVGEPPVGHGPPCLHRPRRRAGDPPAGELVPRMLRGCAHGDLHARNVLVAVVRGRARWPAVFDYEHMGPANLLAWDFVKMETELKTRAYAALFPHMAASRFVREVQKFEVALGVQTEACYNGARWPEADDEEGRDLERLRALLLALRRQAALHLGDDRGRARQWLDEYYFALACYGVHVSRFRDPDWPAPQLRAAYVSAGVATARFLWNREELLEGRP